MRKKKKKREEKEEENITVWQLYTRNFPTIPYPVYFRGKMLQIQRFRGMRKDKEMEKKRRKKDAVHSAIPINLLSLGGGYGKEKDPENKGKSPVIFRVLCF